MAIRDDVNETAKAIEDATLAIRAAFHRADRLRAKHHHTLTDEEYAMLRDAEKDCQAAVLRG